MCGITGIIPRDRFEPQILVQMTDLLRHRGPDDEGYTVFAADGSVERAGGKDTPEEAYACSTPYMPQWQEPRQPASSPTRLAFGYRRLSIHDLSSHGHQPMCYGDRYWIIFNGEVYNFHELRTELEAAGNCFGSHSDTEVILAAYARYGPEAVPMFNGMWAFAIYDQVEQSLFLSRDRFGVKPLYYWVAPDGAFYFASEIKAFTACRGWRASMNGQRVYEFLNWGISDHTSETMFAGVFQIPPGHCLTIDLKRRPEFRSGAPVPCTRWYELRPMAFTGDYQDASELFARTLRESVSLRLRSDVPVGSCLSGGLDSSAIVCMVHRLLGEQGGPRMQKTFSACAHDPRFDERAWVDKVVGATGVEGYYTYPTVEELFEIMPQLAWEQDEPYGSTSIFAQWNVFRLARRHGVVVMLDGQGADEILAGYHEYFGPRLAGLFRRAELRTLLGELRSIRRIHGYSYFGGLTFLGSSIAPRRVRDYFKQLVGRTSVTPVWLKLESLRASPTEPYSDLGSHVGTVDGLSRAHLGGAMLQKLLHWEDRTSMAHSIEARLPFLDYRMVEAMLGLPDDFKIAGGVTKRVMRDGLVGVLPEVVRNRMDKRGFITPEEQWMREVVPHHFRAKVRQVVAESSDVLRKEVLTICDEILSGQRPFSFLIWRLISFGEWRRRYSVGL